MLRLLALVACVLPLQVFAGMLDLLPLAHIERKMIYPLSPEQQEPSALGLRNTHSVNIQTQDGETLVVWVVRANAPGPTVLYFHGNAGNLATRAQRFAWLQKNRINVVAMSYRGSSGSTGKPAQADITSDAQLVYAKLGSLLPGTEHSDVILYGESLGAAVSIALLSSLPRDERPSGVILEAPFTSIPDMARAMTEVPDNLIQRITNKWDSLGSASALTRPLLILHGTRDSVTPIKMGRRLFRAAPVKDKDFVAVAGASHSATWRNDTMPRILKFIRAYGRSP